ncbi:DNA repair protein RecO [Terrimonas pollutisoli]|uniref:DNA repair protein RecO n=1 Tax=Terrimonas pollutisoli TaxID=3034147 RepID=UPI0023ECE295|nr:DNA repair protein RecO [Terrimonas sp. H1YJ31]
MSDKLHHTNGIVLRTVKYGETSVIVSIFTELFGVQSYLVNGVRVSSKKGSGRANLFQPSAILDMIVYHNELKQLQRIKEFKWAHIYQHILSDVRKNAVALYMIELLTKCLKQPESNPDLFHFAEDAFLHLDEANNTVTANLPLFFTLHLPVFFGFRVNDNYSASHQWLDLQEGEFVDQQPTHPHFLDDKQAYVTSQLLKVQQPGELNDIKLNHDFRRNLLYRYEVFYALHLQDFGTLKTLPVLREILG